jgi:hypothetical protein
MSAHDNEDLIDYEDDVVPNGPAHTLSANGALNRGAGEGEADGGARNFSGIHSTGFRYSFLLFLCLIYFPSPV